MNFKRAFGLSFVALFLFGTAALSAAAEHDYRVCRSFDRNSRCIEFDRKCRGGLHESSSGAQAYRCREIAPSQCDAMERLYAVTFERLRRLPASQRDFDSPAGAACNSFSMVVPGHSVSACNGRQNDGADLIYSLFNATQALCDPVGKTARKAKE